MDIEINGVMYRQKEQQNQSPLFRSKMVGMALSLAQMAYGAKSKPLPDVNIPSEYELIQQKKSMLSASDRERIVYHFEKNFEPVTELMELEDKKQLLNYRCLRDGTSREDYLKEVASINEEIKNLTL